MCVDMHTYFLRSDNCAHNGFVPTWQVSENGSVDPTRPTANGTITCLRVRIRVSPAKARFGGCTRAIAHRGNLSSFQIRGASLTTSSIVTTSMAHTQMHDECKVIRTRVNAPAPAAPQE
jgi:hypothetical protein